MTKDSPHRHIEEQHLYWRLGYQCQNIHCLSNKYEIVPVICGASDWEEIGCTKEILAGHPLVTGGRRVLVPLMIGIDEMKLMDNLYTCQWVNEHGKDLPAIIRPKRNHMTIARHPHNSRALPWTLEICTESQKISLHNNLLALLSPSQWIHPVLNNAPTGNILVLKQDNIHADQVEDVNGADIGLIMDVLISAVANGKSVFAGGERHRRHYLNFGSKWEFDDG
ncbi:uncharacterized protein EDB93DRAFT_1108246 [Suillus bovinus]|uniref:uncharacterized protein n=1 Tax=Suillus bovinus TaxID=48563 RepID=UPI001B88571F|nr:uncharacterized protein EDB93DRAFT_1108246 [Suillus bovinus]KAG2130953.1 hypothetical protein EDB93DRAFT_1108246 [Suillus bovinus]